jgi:serine/threonine-protein kinase
MRSLARELDARYREAESFAADLAAAATVVYGPGWLERSGVPVLHLTPRVIAGLNSATSPAPPADARTRPVSRPGATLVGAPEVGEPGWPGAGRAGPGGDAGTGWPGGATGSGADPSETSRAAVVWLRLAAGAAAVVLVVLALLNPARLPHEVSAVVLGGGSAAAPVEVDLSKPVVVTGPGNPGRVALDLSAAGIPLGSASADAKPDGNGFTAELTLPGVARWIVGGAVTAEVRTGSSTQTFTLLTSQHPLASAMGAGSLILALFALAYLESGLRTIRNGHRWRGAAVGGPVLGLLFGATVWLCVSVLRVHEPSPGLGAGCAVAGAVAAGLVVAAARRRASTVVSRPSGR